MPLLLILFLRCSAGVQGASGVFDMMKEHCSGHISLIWWGRKPQPSKIKKGMSVFALYLLKPAEFKLWHVLNSTTAFERIWRNTIVFVIFEVLWQSSAKTLVFYYNLETWTVPKYCHFSRLCLPWERGGNPVWQPPHNDKTIVSQAAGPLAGLYLFRLKS